MPTNNKSLNLTELIKADAKNWQRQKSKIPKLLANEMVNDFTENFDRQGFRDSSTKPWKPRKNDDDPGRGILIGSK